MKLLAPHIFIVHTKELAEGINKHYTNINIFSIFAIPKLSNMTYKKDFARMVWWRYWKQPQRFDKRRTPKLYGFIYS